MEDDQQRLQKMKRRDFGEICERNEVLRMVYKAVRDIQWEVMKCGEWVAWERENILK